MRAGKRGFQAFLVFFYFLQSTSLAFGCELFLRTLAFEVQRSYEVLRLPTAYPESYLSRLKILRSDFLQQVFESPDIFKGPALELAETETRKKFTKALFKYLGYLKLWKRLRSENEIGDLPEINEAKAELLFQKLQDGLPHRAFTSPLRIEVALPESLFEGIRRNQLERVLSDDDPVTLIDYLEEDPFLWSQFRAHSGVAEGSSLREHILLVLRQFGKHFSTFQFSEKLGIGRNFFKLILALHDIGKPRAAYEGNRSKQHIHNREIISVLLKHLQYTDSQIAFATFAVGQDNLGRLAQTENYEETKASIHKGAKGLGIPVPVLYSLLLVYFKSDASSYTRFAGSLGSTLDTVFKLDSESGALLFKPKTAEIFKKFEALLEIVEQ